MSRRIGVLALCLLAGILSAAKFEAPDPSYGRTTEFAPPVEAAVAGRVPGEAEVDANWDADVRLTNNTSIYDYTTPSTQRHVVADAAGRIHVVWYQSTDYSVHYMRYNPGFGWSPDTVIDTDIPYSYVMYPSLALDSSGRVHVVMQAGSTTSAYYYIYWNTCTPTGNSNGGWGTSQMISAATTSPYKQYPTIACAPNGDIHALWREYLSPNYYVSYRHYTGGSWQTQVRFDTFSSSYSRQYPNLAVGRDNNVHVVYYGYNAANPSYYQVNYKARIGGTWQPTENITTGVTVSQYYPTVAVNPVTNNPHVAWRGGLNGSYYRQMHTFKTSGTWQPGDTVSEPGSTRYQYYGQLAAGPTGTMHLVWYSYHPTTSYYQIRYAERSAAGVWSAPGYLTDLPTTDRYWPSVMVDNTGNIHVVWYDYRDGTYSEIYYKHGSPPVSRDAAATNIRVPPTQTNPGVGHYPVVKIKNQGLDTLTGIPVYVWIDSAGTRIYNQTATCAGPLAPGDTALVAMATQWTAGPKGTVYNLTAFTNLATEQNRSNDTTRSNCAVVGAPNRSFSFEWAFNVGRNFAVGVTGVQDTLVWVSCAGWTANTEADYIFVFDARTLALVDSFAQPTQNQTSRPWGIRDMWYNAAEDLVYGGTDQNMLYRINATTHVTQDSFTLTGANLPTCVRGLTGDGDSLYTANFSTSPIIKFAKDGTNAHTVAPAHPWGGAYGLAWDRSNSRTYMSHAGTAPNPLAQYDVPAWVSLLDTVIPYATGTHGGCEMFRNDTFLLVLRQATMDSVVCVRVISVEHDVGVNSIVRPSGAYGLRNLTLTPEATIRNNGANTETNIAVACTIFGTGGVVRFTGAATVPSLAPGVTANVTFGNWTPADAEVCDVAVWTTLAGDQVPANDVGHATANFQPAYMTGGPDAGDYRWIDSDANGGPVYNWIDISTSGTNVPFPSFDDNSASVPMGFNFNFYGNTFNSVFVGTNGHLTFGVGSSDLSEDTIPTAGTPNNLVAPLWDDLHCLNAGTVKYQTLGTTPNCTLVVSYNNVRYYGTGDSTLTFQVLFLEGSNDIVTQYADVIGNGTKDRGSSATVGIENADGTIGLCYEYDAKPAGNLLDAGRAIRFYYTPPVHDVGATKIEAPTGTLVPGAAVTPACSVYNFGNVAETFQVRMVVAGYNNAVTVTGLAAGTAAYVTFPNWSANPPGTHAVTCTTELTGDADNSNDAVTGTVTVGSPDVGVVAIVAPIGSNDTSVVIVPSATVKNHATFASTFTVTFSFDTYTSTQTVTDLAGGAEATVVFDTWVKPHAVGTYPTCCSTYIAGDVAPTNDVVTGSFRIRAGGSGIIGWAKMASVPAGPKGKGVKDGGSLTQIEEGGTAMVYAFKGNGRYEFYKYNTGDNTWATMESIPAIGRAGKKKAVKKGATLSSTANVIYGSKGNNSVEFWQYTPGTDGAWSQKADVPVGAKNCKEGCDAVTVNVDGTDYIYFLKGTNTTEFYRYNTATDMWETKAPAPVGTSGKNFKNGSNLAYDEDKNVIYAVKGSYNEFFVYSVDSDRWAAPLANVPLIGSMGKKKKVKDGAGLVYHGGNAYLVKGGNTNEFWMYKVDSGASWSQLADMPAGAKYVKGGGALVYVPAQMAMFALRGNNQFDFFIYGLAAFMPVAKAPAISAMGDANRNATAVLRIAPNPFSNATTISYSLPSAGNVSLKLYDISGKLVTTLLEGHRPAGSSAFIVPRSALSSGIYLVKLATDASTTTTKLIVE